MCIVVVELMRLVERSHYNFLLGTVAEVYTYFEIGATQKTHTHMYVYI